MGGSGCFVRFRALGGIRGEGEYALRSRRGWDLREQSDQCEQCPSTELVGHGDGGFGFVKLWSEEALLASDEGPLVRRGVADANAGVDVAS